MKKSKTIRTLVAAGCVASAGCVSAPKPRPLPPPEECPPGAAAAHKRFGIYPGAVHGVTLTSAFEPPRVMPVRDGQRVRAEILLEWEHLPERTTFDGRLFLGTERVYGRFTKAILPTGEAVPVCLEVMYIGDHERGTRILPESSATETLLVSTLSIQAVERFQ